MVWSAATTSSTASSGGSIFTSIIDRYASFRSHIARRNLLYINSTIAQGNSELARKKAEIIEIENKINVAGIRKENKEITSTARALVGKSGVQSGGTTGRAVENLAKNLEFRALALEYAGSVRKGEMLSQAEQFELEKAFTDLEAKNEDRAAAFSDPFAYLHHKGSVKTTMFGDFPGS